MESVTIKDIAKMCNVGVSTVSRAINNQSGISEDTKQKIMKAIKESNYIPNNSARNLKRTASRTIAVLIKGIDNTFFNPMISLFEKEVQGRKYTIVIQRVDENQDEIDIAVRMEKEKRLKGIVFLGGSFNFEKKKLEKLSIPYVFSTVPVRREDDSEVAAIAVDDFAESYKIVDYLCKLGHEKIAIVTGNHEDESISNLRFNGYLKALHDNNIVFNDDLVYYLSDVINKYSMKNGYLTAKKILDDKCDCTAIFAVSDSVAIGVCRAIKEAGFSIPDDYSVAGFDGLEIGQYYWPSITTIKQPVSEIACETIKLLFNLINKKAAPQHIIFQGELFEGESTKRLKG